MSSVSIQVASSPGDEGNRRNRDRPNSARRRTTSLIRTGTVLRAQHCHPDGMTDDGLDIRKDGTHRGDERALRALQID